MWAIKMFYVTMCQHFFLLYAIARFFFYIFVPFCTKCRPGEPTTINNNNSSRNNRKKRELIIIFNTMNIIINIKNAETDSYRIISMCILLILCQSGFWRNQQVEIIIKKCVVYPQEDFLFTILHGDS
jgi:hypothetical protein